MNRIPKAVFIAVPVMLTLACSLVMQPAPKAPSPTSTRKAAPTLVPSLVAVIPSRTALAPTQTAETPATPTQAPAPPDTAVPVTTPTASLASADTAAPVSTPTASPVPTAASTLPVALPAENPTTLALLGPMADLMGISQYYNPVGTPLSSWHTVPIMPQAFAGQEFKADVYSYKAKAVLSQAVQYYTSKAASMGLPAAPATGYGGTGSLAFHSTTFFSHNLIIVITSLDNDPQQVIVVIDKAP